MGSVATIEGCGAIESGFNCVMLTDRKLRIAWKAYLAELATMQMAEHPSEAVVAERLRQYLSDRLTEATRVLSLDSSRLAEVLIEILELRPGTLK